MEQRFFSFSPASSTAAVVAAILLVAPAAFAASRQWSDSAAQTSITSTRRRIPASTSSLAVAAPDLRSTSALTASSGSSTSTRSLTASSDTTTLVFSIEADAIITDANGLSLSVAEYRDPATGGGINEAHIRVTGGDAPPDLYLLIYTLDENGNSYLDPDVTYAYFDGDFNCSRNLQADISDYVSSGYSLELQLGFYNENNDSFTLLATATSPLSELLDSYTYSSHSLGPPNKAWTPNYVAVTPGIPEPASGALLVLGALALFRRRRPRRPWTR